MDERKRLRLGIQCKSIDRFIFSANELLRKNIYCSIGEIIQKIGFP